MRERGLKYKLDVAQKRVAGSLPVRERGLKYLVQVVGGLPQLSLPVRERGLKFTNCIDPLADQRRSLCGSVG